MAPSEGVGVGWVVNAAPVVAPAGLVGGWGGIPACFFRLNRERALVRAGSGFIASQMVGLHCPGT